MHASVDLEVDRCPGIGHRGEGLDPSLRVDGGSNPTQHHHLGHLFPSWLGQQQDRGIEPAAPQGGCLFHQSYSQPSGTSPEGRLGHRQGTMAVAVGLDHRAHLGRGY